MSYECQILKDSISDQGYRLTTFVVTFPRFILAEVNTHRMLSRNSASSRAIPVAKSIQAVRDDPFVPESFGRNQMGMQAGEALEDEAAQWASNAWGTAIDFALEAAETLAELEVHKSLANRILEPFKWHTAVITATDWSNFFALRTHPDAQPEFRTIALQMRRAYQTSEPQILDPGQWHMPFVSDEEFEAMPNYDHWKPVSIGRCARVSYLTHFGFRDPQADIALTMGRLLPSGHLSPFEHVARPFTEHDWNVVQTVSNAVQNGVGEHASYLRNRLEYCANLRGWRSARTDIRFESDFGQAMTAAQEVTDAVH